MTHRKTRIILCVEPLRYEQEVDQMALDNVPTVDDLAETTGQSRDQLEKDREATTELAKDDSDE